jgi:hypothetical protein
MDDFLIFIIKNVAFFVKIVKFNIGEARKDNSIFLLPIGVVHQGEMKRGKSPQEFCSDEHPSECVLRPGLHERGRP